MAKCMGILVLSKRLRDRVMPLSALDGEANLLVFPNLDAANITLSVVKQMTNALHVGPILLGANAQRIFSPLLHHAAWSI